MDATRNDLIKHCTAEEWDEFKDHVEMVDLEDLARIADRLGSSQRDSWQEYADDFSEYEWDDFIEAYKHVTYKDY